MYRKHFLILLMFTSLFARWISREKSEAGNRIIDKVINCQFNEALNICDSLKKSDKSDPYGYALTLIVYEMRNVDLDNNVDSAGFIRCFNNALEKIKTYNNEQGSDSYSLTLAGIINAVHASFFLRNQEYFTAIGTGLESLGLLKDAKEKDTTNYDVECVSGLYDYAKSELKKKLWMLLFWYPGTREDGIRSLELAIDSGYISGKAARMFLSDIFIREKRFTEAFEMIGYMEKKYPESRFVLWSKVKYYEAMDKKDSASFFYGVLADSYSKVERGKYNKISTLAKQASMQYEAGLKKQAFKLAKSVLNEIDMIDEKERNRYKKIRKKTGDVLKNER